MRPLMAILLITVLASCKKDNYETNLPAAVKFPNLPCSKKTNQIDTLKQMIVGTYDWAYTNYWAWRQPPEIWTPENKNLTYRYVFKPNAEVDYYENKKLQWTNKYVVDYELRVSTYYLDSAAMVIMYDKETGQRREFFRAYCVTIRQCFTILIHMGSKNMLETLGENKPPLTRSFMPERLDNKC